MKRGNLLRRAPPGRRAWAGGVILAAMVGLVALAALAVRQQSETPQAPPLQSAPARAHPLDLSGYSEAPPGRPLHLLFIHHSCGGQLLATPGPAVGNNCIYPSHPNGGGLRARLQQNGYLVHEASYGSRLGENTDLFDWLPKFWKRTAKRLLGRTSAPVSAARLARQFNNWLSDKDGWLKDSGLTNVVVFDYYDILTRNGASNLSCYPTASGSDSHPSRAGNAKAAEAFVPFLNRAVRRAGLVQ